MTDVIDNALWSQSTEANRLMKENGVRVSIGFISKDNCWRWFISVGEYGPIFAHFDCDEESMERFMSNLNQARGNKND